MRTNQHQRAAIARGFLSTNPASDARPMEAIMTHVLRAALAAILSVVCVLLSMRPAGASVVAEQTLHDGTVCTSDSFLGEYVDLRITGLSGHFGSITILASSGAVVPDAMMQVTGVGNATAAVGTTMGPVTFDFTSFNYTFDPARTYDFLLYSRQSGGGGAVMQQEGSLATTAYPAIYLSNLSHPCAMVSPYFIIDTTAAPTPPQIIEATFTGTVDQVTNFGFIAPGNIIVGTPVLGHFRYDTAAIPPNTSPSPFGGEYNFTGGNAQFSFEMNGLRWASGPDVSVFTGTNALTMSDATCSAPTTFPPLCSMDMSITGGVLSGPILPTSASQFNLAAASDSRGNIIVGDNRGFFYHINFTGDPSSIQIRDVAPPPQTYTPNVPVPSLVPSFSVGYPSPDHVLVDTTSFVTNNQSSLSPEARQFIQAQIQALSDQSSAYQPLSADWKIRLGVASRTLGGSVGALDAYLTLDGALAATASLSERVLGFASYGNSLSSLLPTDNQSLQTWQFVSSTIGAGFEALTTTVPVFKWVAGDVWLWGTVLPMQLDNLAKDPPAVSYAEPISIPILSLPPVTNAGTPEINQFLTEFNDVTSRVSLYAQAVSASIDRYAAACAAGDGVSAIVQLEAMLDYLRLLGDALRDANAVFNGLPTFLTLSGFANLPGDISTWQNLQSGLIATGFPADFISLLTENGISQSQIDVLYSDLTHRDLSTLTRGPHLVDATASAAQALASIAGPTSVPTTLATSSPPANATGWNNTNVTVSLIATVAPGDAGVKQISYATTGAQVGAAVVAGGSASVMITVEGTTNLTYFATDIAGIAESPKTLTVRVDLHAPTVTCASPVPTFTLNQSGATVSATVADTLSGPATPTVSATVPTSTAGQFSAALAGADLAGNTATAICPYSVATPSGPPKLAAVFSAKSGPVNARQWTVKITNNGTSPVTNVLFTALSLTQTFGAACTPVILSALPVALGNIAAGGSATGVVSIDFTGCALTARFTATLAYSANGAAAGSKTLYNQFQ